MALSERNPAAGEATPPVTMLERLRSRKEWQFFGVLQKADRRLALIWWAVLLLRGVLPAVFAVAAPTLACQTAAIGSGTCAFRFAASADTAESFAESGTCAQTPAMDSRPNACQRFSHAGRI